MEEKLKLYMPDIFNRNSSYYMLYEFYFDENTKTLNGFIGGWEGSHIKISDSSNLKYNFKIKIEKVHSMHYINETYLLVSDSYNLMRNAKQDEDLRGIYIFENSKYLKWFHENTNFIYGNKNLKHFLISTDEENFEIITEDEIKIEFVR